MQYWADLQSVNGLRCYGNITRTRKVSEYILVLAMCLVLFVLDYFKLTNIQKITIKYMLCVRNGHLFIV